MSSSPPTEYYGIDRAGDCWIAVGLHAETTPDVVVDAPIGDVWDWLPSETTRVLIDCPIGLFQANDGIQSGNQERTRCPDELARSLVGDQWRSVFNAPAQRAAKYAATGKSKAQIQEANEKVVGKSLTPPERGIADIVYEVDCFLQQDSSPARGILEEAHPELCFRAFAGSPLEHKKTTAAGVFERLSILNQYLTNRIGSSPASIGDNIDAATGLLWKITDQLDGAEAAVDDVIDATVLALTAFLDEEYLWSLPREPDSDATGLPMQMRYWAKEPFEICNE